MIKTWILGIVSAICITTLIDVLLSEGETKKYTKTIAGLLVLVAIIMPIPEMIESFDNATITFSKANSISTKEEYLEYVTDSKTNIIVNSINNNLEEKGIIGTKIEISYTIIDNQYKINKIIVDTQNIVINNKEKNIDIKNSIKTIILNTVDIEEQKIEFIEK